MRKEQRHRTPPRFATWLLNRFSGTRYRRALAGDLLEEFRAGQSRAWFWRQTAVVILGSLWRHAFSTRWLVPTTLIFAGFAAIDCGFWSLHLASHVNTWIELAVSWLGAAFLWWLPTRNAEETIIGWRLAAKSTLLVAYLSFFAWISTASLSQRLERDAGMAVFIGLRIALDAARESNDSGAEKPRESH